MREYPKSVGGSVGARSVMGLGWRDADLIRFCVWICAEQPRSRSSIFFIASVRHLPGDVILVGIAVCLTFSG